MRGAAGSSEFPHREAQIKSGKKIIHTAGRLSNRCDWLTEMKGDALKVEVVH